MQKPYNIVQTDCGDSEVYNQGPRASIYTCPMCLSAVKGEWHVVIVPIENRNLRRHAHKECLEAFISQDLDIRLLPGAYRGV